MRNIWNNDEPELLPFTATWPGSGCGKVDPHSGVVRVDLAFSWKRRGSVWAVILMMLWY